MSITNEVCVKVELIESRMTMLRKKERLFCELRDIEEESECANEAQQFEAIENRLKCLQVLWLDLKRDIQEFNERNCIRGSSKMGELCSIQKHDILYGECKIEKIFTICSKFLTSSKKKQMQLTKENTPNESEGKISIAELPTFEGDMAKWEEFHNLFQFLVHKKNYSDIEKLNYLRLFVKGEALDIVSQFKVVASSYELAYDALKDRYANPKQTAKYHLSQILSYKFNEYVDPVEERARLVDIHMTAISDLQSLKLSDFNDLVLFELFYRNLPTNMQEEFDEQKTSDMPTLQELLDFIAKPSAQKLKQADKQAKWGAKKKGRIILQ